MAPQIKVKVLRRPQIKLKVLPKFPTNVTAASPIVLGRTGGNYDFSLSITDLRTSLDPVYAAYGSGGSTDASSLTSGTLNAARLPLFTQTGTGAVARTIMNKLTAVVSILDFGAATTNTAAQNTTAINLALAVGGNIYVPPGTYTVTNDLSITQNNTRFFGASSGLSIITTAVNNAALVKIAVGLSGVVVEDLGLTRTVTAIAGATGIICLGTLAISAIRRCEIQNQYVGAILSATGYSEFDDNYIHDCRWDGIELINTATSGSMQWRLQNNLVQGCASRGIIVISAAGPAQVTLGDWIHNYSFANSSFAMAFIGLAGVPVNGIRITGGFLGEDGNSEIYLDTYGGQHNISGTFCELAGTRTTGPSFGTAASGIGSGIEITANNTDVTISDVKCVGNKDYGIRTLATAMTAINDGRFANNTQRGVLIGDGTKAVLNGSTFANNTAGTHTVTSNASSIVAGGNFPATINNLAGFDTNAWTSYTPTVSSGSGTLTTASATLNYKIIGKICIYEGTITITTNGTGATDIRITSVPFTSINFAPALGYEDVNTGKICAGAFYTLGSIAFRFYDGTYPGGNGNKIRFSGSCEVA